MGLSVDNLPAVFDQPPQLAVGLDRLVSAGGMLTGEQEHVYGYAPIGGMSFTANATLTRATVRTGTSIDPSAIHIVDQTPDLFNASPTARPSNWPNTFVSWR